MGKFTVFTIDDDQDFNMVLKMVLARYDIDVKTHTNAQDFTESVKSKMPDVCILDLNLEKDGEGFQLLKAMRNVLGKKLPILVMSKRGSREDVFKVMETGANDFIPKPLDDKYLILKLKEYLPENQALEELDHSYSKVFETDREASIEMGLEVVKVGVDEFEVQGSVFLTKEMNIKVEGAVLKNIFNEESLGFKVIDSWQISDSLYGAKLERELTIEQLFSLRRWLMSKSGDGDQV